MQFIRVVHTWDSKSSTPIERVVGFSSTLFHILSPTWDGKTEPAVIYIRDDDFRAVVRYDRGGSTPRLTPCRRPLALWMPHAPYIYPISPEFFTRLANDPFIPRNGDPVGLKDLIRELWGVLCR